MIRFGDFRPDSSRFDPNYLDYMRNAQPVADGWAPFPSFTTYSQALPEAPVSSAMARKVDGSYVIYAGTRTNLYKLDPSDKSWTSVGSGFTLSDGETWSFLQFGTKLLAANRNQNVQVVDLETGTNFADLAGSPPKGRSLFTIGANVFIGGLLNAPDSVQWSGTENAEVWGDVDKGADIQQFPDRGWVLSGFSNEQGAVILQKGGARFASWNPGQMYNFTFRPVSEIGVVGANAAAQVGSAVFFLSDRGFYSIIGGQTQAIGAEKVDRWFTQTANLDKLDEVQAVSDPLNKVVYWAFASSGYSGEGFNRVLGYDWQLQRWFVLEISMLLLTSAATPGHTLESLDEISSSLDDLSASLDSPAWTGGKPVLAGFNSDYELCFAHGSNLDAMFETSDIQFNQNSRSKIISADVLTDCDSVTLEVGSKDKKSSNVSYALPVNREADGRFALRSDALMHKFRVNLSGDWEAVHGIDDIEAVRTGKR
jgi:hypothetical protein